MNNTVRKIIDNFQNHFSGNPWYGDSVMVILNSVNYKTVNQKPHPAINPIGRIIHHMINWRIFLIKKLEGDLEFDIRQNDQNDWPDILIHDEQEWLKAVSMFKDTQQKILTLLSSKGDNFLTQSVPGREYNFQFLIEGLIQHDIYHIGQISLIKKMMGQN